MKSLMQAPTASSVLAGLWLIHHAQGLSPPCREAYCHLLLAMGLLNAKSFAPGELETAARFVIEAVAMVELRLPLSMLTMQLHMLLHAPQRALSAGPLACVSAWGDESPWGKLKKMATSKCSLEVTAFHSVATQAVANLAHLAAP